MPEEKNKDPKDRDKEKGTQGIKSESSGKDLKKSDDNLQSKEENSSAYIIGSGFSTLSNDISNPHHSIGEISGIDLSKYYVPVQLNPSLGVFKYPSVFDSTQALQSVFDSTQTLQEDIAQLKGENNALLKEISESKSDSAKQIAARKKYEEKAAILERKEKLSYILGHVNLDARKKLLEDDSFLKLFESKRSCNAYVVAIDIRRSTELMLKAKSAEEFARFITGLCEALSNIILNNYGIFEKFTGDGILSFFPEYYSGSNSGNFAVKAALECHAYFETHYRKHRNSFTSVLNDIGLGIGIDFGLIHVVNLQNALSIVGVPVVYACRMSGAKAGQTLLNQSAFADVLRRYSTYFNLTETTIDVKNEGSLVAYNITSNGSEIPVVIPNWDEIIANEKAASK